MSLPLKKYYALLQLYLWPQWRRLGWLVVALLAGIALQLLPPQLMRRFLDTATVGGALATLTPLALWIMVAVLMQQICAVLAAYLGEDVAWTATNRLRYQLMEHCLHLDLTFHHARTPGEMIERIDSDVTLLANFFSQFVVVVGGNLLLLLGVLALLFQVDWRIGLLGVALALLMLFTLARLRNLGIPYATAHRQSNAELYAFLEERLGGMEEIRANGAVAYTMQRFYGLLRNVFHKSLWENWTFSLPFATLILIASVGMAIALALCALLFTRGVMTIGTVYLVFHYMALLSLPIDAMTRQIEDLQRAGGSIVRLEELQAIQTLVQDANDASSRLAEGALAVQFDHVTFGYAPETPVLQAISFQLQPGIKLGLLGRTGSGKSSLVRLLLRFYDPAQGVIRVGNTAYADLVTHTGDNRESWGLTNSFILKIRGDMGNNEQSGINAGHGLCDVRQLPLAQLRQQVGLVTQHVQLFHATLRDNLSFWDPTLADGQLIEAFHNLGLDDWLQTLPNGLDTLLTADGGALSAGEAQLVAFARIFLRNPGLIILDEAASRLDPTTTARLDQAIDRLLVGRTAIIIAHQLATVRRVDEIMILDKGRIVEHGQRTVLEQEPTSRFYHLLQTGMAEVLA